MLKPALALVSMNMTLNSRALASPSSMDTCLQTEASIETSGQIEARAVALWTGCEDPKRAVCRPCCRNPHSEDSSRHVPLINKVCLVAHQHNNDIAPSLCPDLLNPPRCVEERLPICAEMFALSRASY